MARARFRVSFTPMTDTNETGRRWHDMGGRDAGAIAQGQHDYALWEKRVDALLRITSSKGYFTVDGLRRVLEDMPEESYETMTYYERWIASITETLLEKGVFSVDELGRAMDDVQRQWRADT